MDNLGWNKSEQVTISVSFPNNARSAKLIITPKNPSVVIKDDGSSTSGYKNAKLSVNDVGSGIYASEYGTDAQGKGNIVFNTVTKEYTFNDIESHPGVNFYVTFTNSNIENFSNNPDVSTLSDCIEIKLEYVDSTGQTIDSIDPVKLSVNSCDHVESEVSSKTGTSYPSNNPYIVKAGDTEVSSRKGDKYMFLIYFKGVDSKGNVVASLNSSGIRGGHKYLLKSVKLNFKYSKNAEGLISYGDWEEKTETKNCVDDPNTANSYCTVDLYYNGGTEGNIENNYVTAEVKFDPSINIPSNPKPANETVYTFSVLSGEIEQYGNYTVNQDGVSASGTAVKTEFNAKSPYSEAYYKVQEFGKLFVQSFTTGDTINFTNDDVKDDHTTIGGIDNSTKEFRTMQNIAWYNPSYPNVENIVGYFQYGVYGSLDIEKDMYVDVKLNSTDIGVRGIRLPMSVDDYNNITKKTWSVEIATTQNPTLHTVKIDKVSTGWNGSKWACVYLDSNDLGLSENEYLTEIKYPITKIINSTTENVTATNKHDDEGHSDSNYGLIFGKILNWNDSYATNNKTFVSNTTQIFDSTGVALTGAGNSKSTISGSKRVNQWVISPTVTTKSGKSNLSNVELVVKPGQSAKFEYSINSDKNYNDWSKNMGYSPITEFYIRDLFGGTSQEDLLSSLTIKNELTGNYLVRDGEIINERVSIEKIRTETDHTKYDNYDLDVNVYKITINRENLASEWDNVVGQYSNLKQNNSRDWLNAKMTVSYNLIVPNDIDEATLLQQKAKFDCDKSLYVKFDSNADTNGQMLVNNSQSIQSDGYYRCDDYDVDGDGQLSNADSDIAKAGKSVKLVFEAPPTETKLLFDNEIKGQNENEYLTYDSKKASDSTVDLYDNGTADLKVLVGNYSSNIITGKTNTEGSVTKQGFKMYLPIPKKGENWGKFSNTDISDSTQGFAFTINLEQELTYEGGNDTYKVTYAKITPTETLSSSSGETSFSSQDNLFESYKEANKNEYNCIKIECIKDQLPSFRGTESTDDKDLDSIDQMNLTKYFITKISYGDKDENGNTVIPTSTLYDIWKSIASYYITYPDKSGNPDNSESESAQEYTTVNYIGVRIAAPTFTVTTTVTNGSVDKQTGITGTNTVTYGTEYEVEVKPNTGYELPKLSTDIVVKVGDRTLVNDEFTYENGKVTVPGDKITGNIEITVPCTPKTFTSTVITPNGTHSETTTPTPTYGQPYTTTVKPNTNYELPKDKTNITVTVDDKTLNSEDFDYNPSTGEVTVHGEKVTGNITINVPSTPKKFTVTTTVTNGSQTVGSNSDTLVYGTSYNTTVKPNTHYEYPSTITVTVGDKTLTVGDDYTYNSSTGEITVIGSKITGNIVITVVCTKEPYKVTGIDEYVSGSNKYVVSVTDASLGTEKPEFAGVADITVNKDEINEGETVSATLKITSPNFTLDKDNVYVEITDYDGNHVATYNYSDNNSKVTIVKAGETKGITSGSNPLIKLSLTNKFTKLTTGPVTLHEDKVPTANESYTITVDGSVVTGNVKFYTPIVAKVTSDTDVVNGTETGNTAEGSTTNDVVNIPIDNSATGLGLKTQVYESDVKANSGKLLPSTVDSNVKVTIGGVELTGVLLSNIDEASTLTDGQFGYLPVKDSNGKYTEAKVIVPSLDLLKTTYPNLAVIIKVVPYDEPSSKTSSSTGTSPHVTCEQYMRSDKWTWSEATQSCALKVTTSDGYVVPNTADKSK